MKRFLVLFSALAQFSLSAAILPVEKLLPDDTLFFVATPDANAAGVVYKNSPQGQLWNDPSMKAFKDNFMKKFRTDMLEPFEKELGFKFSDYQALAQGEVVFAITKGDPDKPDGPIGMILLLDAKDKSGKLKSHLADLKSKWRDLGKEIKTDKIRDVEFTTLMTTGDEFSKVWKKVFPGSNDSDATTKDSDDKKAGKKIEISVGQFESLLVVGNSPKLIEKILARQSGGLIPTISDLPVYESNHNLLFRDAQAYAWLNAQPLLEMFTKSTGKQPDGAMGFSPQKMLSTLGITGLKSAAFAYASGTDGAMIKMLLGVPEADRKGLFKILAPDAKDASPLPFISADVAKFNRVRLDLQKTWNSAESLFVEVSPQLGGVFKMIFSTAGKEQDPNFDLRRELIGNLGDDIVNYEKNPKGSTIEELDSAPDLYLIGSPNSEKLAIAIKVALTSLGQQRDNLKEREFLGRKIYTLVPPSLGATDPRKPQKALSFAGSGGYVAFSTDAATLEEYLRSSDFKGKTLKETAGLGDAAEKVGGMGTGLFGYKNPGETIRLGLDAARKDPDAIASLVGATAIGGKLGIADDNKKLKEWADFSLLPTYEMISKYFTYAVYAGSFTPDGFLIKSFSPTPPALKK